MERRRGRVRIQVHWIGLTHSTTNGRSYHSGNNDFWNETQFNKVVLRVKWGVYLLAVSIYPLSIFRFCSATLQLLCNTLYFVIMQNPNKQCLRSINSDAVRPTEYHHPDNAPPPPPESSAQQRLNPTNLFHVPREGQQRIRR